VGLVFPLGVAAAALFGEVEDPSALALAFRIFWKCCLFGISSGAYYLNLASDDHVREIEFSGNTRPLSEHFRN
jgi:hypothetical protein